MIDSLKKHIQNFLLPSAIFTLSALIFLPNLGRHFLWQDEAQTALISRSILTEGIPYCHDYKNSFSQELGAECSSNGIYKWHPWVPFYIHAVFFYLFGQSDFMARFPDALFGIGTVILCYRVMQMSGKSRRASLLAACILLFMVPFLILSRQCRYYSMAAFFSMSSIYSYFQLLRSDKRAGIKLTVFTILLFHTQIIYGFIFLITLLIHSALMGKEVLKRLYIPMACVFWGVVPWLAYISEISYKSRYGDSIFNLANTTTSLFNFLERFETYVVPWYFLLFIIGIIMWRRKRNLHVLFKTSSHSNFLILYTIISIAILSLTAPFWFFRYLTPILPVCALLIAEIIELGMQINLLFGCVSLIAILVNQPLINYSYELTHKFRGPMEALAGHLRQNAQASDTVVISYEDMPIKWYTDLRVFGGLTGEDLKNASNVRWVILRTYVIDEKDLQVALYLKDHVPWQQYRKIVLDAPDTPYENREDPRIHYYRTVTGIDSVSIYERIR